MYRIEMHIESASVTGIHTVSPVSKVAESEAADQKTHVENGLEHVDPPGVRAHQVKLETTLRKNLTRP